MKGLKVLLLAVLVGLGVATIAMLTVGPAHSADLWQPKLAAGIGAVSPMNLGYLESLKGAIARTYAYVQLGQPTWKKLGASVRLEQVVQRQPNGHRPGMIARAEVGWTF
jgi:hypothetical protein